MKVGIFAAILVCVLSLTGCNKDGPTAAAPTASATSDNDKALRQFIPCKKDIDTGKVISCPN
ncbi:hypothetical protein [Trinickia mobilis]|uniref:hypothetical protein n=1 Tax=Trinickia mobilis TaxID=2816356 RepID=UPI001A8E2E21|nr:hypothetical protein [Trinickia mobilis]